MISRFKISEIISVNKMPKVTSLRKCDPRAIRIMLSAETAFEAVSRAINEAGVHKYLSKHWDAAHLRAEVREATVRQREKNP